jgi:hypothetical protein
LELRNEIPLVTRGSSAWIFILFLTLIQQKDTPLERNEPRGFSNQQSGDLRMMKVFPTNPAISKLDLATLRPNPIYCPCFIENLSIHLAWAN